MLTHTQISGLWDTGSSYTEGGVGEGKAVFKLCLENILDSVEAKTMGTGLYPQGLKEIQIGLPRSGSTHGTRLQPDKQGSGLSCVKIGFALNSYKSGPRFLYL